MAERKDIDDDMLGLEGGGLILHDDEEGDADEGLNHHTLRLTCSTSVKSEVFCFAFSDDGRCVDGRHIHTRNT